MLLSTRDIEYNGGNLAPALRIVPPIARLLARYMLYLAYSYIVGSIHRHRARRGAAHKLWDVHCTIRMEMGFALLPFYSKKKAFVHVKRWWVRTCTFRVEPGDVSFSRTTWFTISLSIGRA